MNRSREDEMPISPRPDSPVPEIFSSKKIFFLNSSYSESRRSEIPHIESDYYPRDQVRRRLFQRDGDSCDCDCSSDGCLGCLRRNKHCFLKFFVLALSIALILLLFGSLSYNLSRNKAGNGSFDKTEWDQTEWVSHYHEYSAPEEKQFPRDEISVKPVLDSPVPVYEHSEDYDSGEDLQSLQYHLDENQEHIEPISSPQRKADSRDAILIIYDEREPPRMKRDESQDFRRAKRGLDRESLFEQLNEVEDGMEKFWELYFKKGKTVFEPFSLTTPLQSTPLQSDEYSEEDDYEDRLKIKLLDLGTQSNFDKVTAEENAWEEAIVVTKTPSGTIATSESDLDQQDDAFQTEEDYTKGDDDVDGVTAAVPGEETSGPKEMDSPKENVDQWSFIHISAPFSGLFGSSQQDEISAEPAPSDTVKGISLADAKKLKIERRKHGLLNSRVVGGSSDVRLPTGPDVSKPFVNAFETLKTNQQLSFTPSAASQFVLPYQMCLFATSFPGLRSPPHAPQPRTISFGIPPFVPPVLDRTFPPKPPQQVPAQQNFLSFSINNFPNAVPPRQPTQPSGGSVFNFPAPQAFSLGSKQPIFCTYLQPPLFQFPTVPGTADFSHAKCVDCQDDSQSHGSLAEGPIFPSGREILCSDDKVSCVDGSGCVPVENWCDNRVHCRDASDEAFCSCRERVAKDRLCDGYVDCPHGEDETGCFDCPKSAFGCDGVISPESCIPLSKRCDGVRDCATGSDEADCSAIFFHVRQNDSYHVSQVTGFLHRNWRGDWFPVCVEIGRNVWAEEACRGESGVLSSGTEVRFAPVPPLYKGPFIVRKADGTTALQDHCKGHVSTFVKCPPVSCGTRIEHPALREIENRHFRAKQDAFDDRREPHSEERKVAKREETGRVVGGRESEPRAWPWAIAVYKNGAFHCGGVILDENWVLTAAHCMEQYWKHYYEVRGGMLRRFSFSAMEQARTVSHVVIHENYDLTIMSSDLALLRLEKPFHFNRWVRPACLPVLQDGLSKFVSGPAPGTRCTAVGWGALRERGTDPDQLREVEIPILVRCTHKEDLIGEEICAGRTEGGKDTCQGDSGGPLMCRDSGSPASWYVAGIVSHGEGCARPGEPGAYTRISLFVDWITANANDFRLPSVRPLQGCPGFRCRSASQLCIPPKWVCNGYADCLEAEDEKNCSSESSNVFNRPYSAGYKYLEVDGGNEKLGKKPSVENTPVTPEFVSDASVNAEVKKERTEKKEESKVFEQLRDWITTEEVKKTTEGLFRSSVDTEHAGNNAEAFPREIDTSILTTGAVDEQKDEQTKQNGAKYEEELEIDRVQGDDQVTQHVETKESTKNHEDELDIEGVQGYDQVTQHEESKESTKNHDEELRMDGMQSDDQITQETKESTKDPSEETEGEYEEVTGDVRTKETKNTETEEEHEVTSDDPQTSDNFLEYSAAIVSTIEEIPRTNEEVSTDGRDIEEGTNSVETSAGTEMVTPEASRMSETQETEFVFSLTSEDSGTPETESAFSATPEASRTSVTPETKSVFPEASGTETAESTEAAPTSDFTSETALRSSDTSTNASRRSEGDLEYFQCRLIVQSILFRYRCDGFQDCEDGTDEENCSCGRELLASNPKLICDGRSDCPDGSDEEDCSKCRKGEFHCKVSDQCIPLLDRCDGHADCKFGEDEAKCLALAKGREIRLRADGEPFLETEGMLIVNRNGVWTSKCQEENSTFAAGEAIEVCSDLGTIGYDRYENRSSGLNCTGFHVSCTNALVSSVDAYRNLDGSYLWPWNAVVYSDGRRVCSAVLLRSRWLLSSSRCLEGISLKQNYVAASLGALGTEIVRVDGVHLIPDSDVALLHLSEEVRQTESVRFLGIPYAFDSDSERDSCVAVGDRTVFLKISDECPETFRCFRKTGPTPSGCRSDPWIGVVVCQSRFGWYPSSVFSENSGHCGFERSNLTDLSEVSKPLLRALDETVEVFPAPDCTGFRCPRGVCIPRGRICNGWPDCTSGEDESFELCKPNKEMKGCRTTDLKCRNGRCIPKVLFGDGKDDCGDESDEPRNKTCVEYLRLTSPKRICDGRRNCYDKTDEDYKTCPCDGDKFQCKLSGYCIPKDFVCDNEKDCPGGEDEERCMGRKTVRNHARTHLEIMQKSYGVWHGVCLAGPMSKERSDSLCRDLGFEGALSSFERNQTVIVPEIDAFSWVKLNQKTSVALRGDKPFVRLAAAERTCTEVQCA